MNTAVAASTHPGPRRGSTLGLALAVAVIAFATVVVGLVLAIVWPRPSTVFELGFLNRLGHLLTLVPAAQWSLLVLGCAATGSGVALGIGSVPIGIAARCSALVSGVLLPVGLVALAKTLNARWPNLGEREGEPVLTVILVGYILIAPWVIGRMLGATRR